MDIHFVQPRSYTVTRCFGAVKIDLIGDASLLGCYRGLPVGCSLCVLVQVDGEPTAVFVLPRDQDPHPTLADRDDLTLQRRTLDDLVLYAVSTEARGDALQRFAP